MAMSSLFSLQDTTAIYLQFWANQSMSLTRQHNRHSTNANPTQSHTHTHIHSEYYLIGFKLDITTWLFMWPHFQELVSSQPAVRLELHRVPTGLSAKNSRTLKNRLQLFQRHILDLLRKLRACQALEQVVPRALPVKLQSHRCQILRAPLQ